MSREPTEAEAQALASAEAERLRQLREGTGIDGEPDMLAIVRAVIRSLRDPSPEIIDAVQRIAPDLVVGADIPKWFAGLIDAASPEVER